MDWWESRQRKPLESRPGAVWIEALEGHWAEGNWSSSSGDTAFHQLMESIRIWTQSLWQRPDGIECITDSSREGVAVPVSWSGWF